MYIDGVFSGGGIKGFALIGAYKAIEEKGLYFKRLAGTSAGAIIASFIAAGYTSKEILEIVDELDLSTFTDARKTWIPFRLGKWLLLYWRLGLFKGDVLENWLEEKLAQKGVKTFGDMPKDTLRIIASDISNGRMLVLPGDLEQYGINPNSFSVAKAVRMSCSLPYFFEPVRLQTVSGPAIIVDGGVLSNFPMWLFDKEDQKKARPVLGIKLSSDIYFHSKNKINNALELYEALFKTMKNAHDARYISRKHEKNIIFIPSKGIETTEFDLSEEQKQKLINAGRQKTEQFLKEWSY